MKKVMALIVSLLFAFAVTAIASEAPKKDAKKAAAPAKVEEKKTEAAPASAPAPTKKKPAGGY